MKTSSIGLRFSLGVAVSVLFVQSARAVYSQINGMIVIEAEHFETSRPASGHAWQIVTSPAGFVGDSAMQALPNNGANISANIQSNSPALTFLGRFTNTGTFNFWVRAWGANGSDDSVHVGVDQRSPQNLSFGGTGTWVWQSRPVTITNVGVHEINVWMREDGAYVDRIVLAANLSYTPTGAGPPEIPENQPPIVQFTSPPSGMSFRAGTTIALSANATDPDGSVARVDFFSNGGLIARFTSAPYYLAWTPPEGVNLVQTIATDDLGTNGAGTLLSVNITNSAVAGPTFRYASSANRIYVEGGGVATLTTIKAALPNAPLQLVDPDNRIWILRANIVVADGSTLSLHGGAVGGDVNELRLLSINTDSTNRFVCIDADWGTLDLDSVHVTSWNEPLNGPNIDGYGFPRAYIRARSRQIGPVLQQSTLNVVNSEIAFLGYNDSEAYGLTWQVVSSVENVKVFGNVSDNLIYDCELGVSTWSVDGVTWTDNEIAFNTLYSFDEFDAGHQAVLAGNFVYNNNYRATFRWAGTSNRIYVTGPGDATLSEVYASLPNAPLQLVDPVNKIWYLGANLFVEKGARLMIYGPAAGGEIAELRLKSDNTFDTNAFVEVRADYGWLDIRSTRITSWDSAVNGPDTETDFFRRAYIRARSTLDTNGVTAHESRMDIIDSDIGFLGSHNTEAYGLTWKVVDTTAAYLPPGSTNTLFDVVNVHGDIINSRLHHNYFGMYSYGHYGGYWANNEVDHNIGYGFDPHDDSDYLTIEGNNVHDNGWHGIIASKRCDHGIMRDNVSWHNGRDPLGRRGNGLMLHRSCNDWVVEGNRSYDNSDSGIALFETSRTLIRDNLCLYNDNAGIRMSVGAADNIVVNNDFGYCGTNGIYLYEGNDPPEVDDEDPEIAGRPRRNLFYQNLIYEIGSEAIKFNNADDNVLQANNFALLETTNVMQLRFEESNGNLMLSNALPVSILMRLIGSTNLSPVTLIEGQPKVTIQLDEFSTATFRDGRGAVFDIGQTNKVTTIVDATASFASITISNAGDASTVTTRNLLVSPNSGNVHITPTSWSLSGNQVKSWTAQASNGTASVLYTVGDLAAGSSYAAAVGSPAVAFGSYIANAQGRISFMVNDSAQRPLAAPNNFTVTYQAVHNGPVLSPKSNRMLNEFSTLTVNNAASYNDVPQVPLTYTLRAVNLADNSVIPNATISGNGTITWTPTELQGPSTNRFTTTVTDGSLHSTNSFLVTVTELSTPPVLPPQADHTTDELTWLFVLNPASDADLPAQPLTYGLTALRLPGNIPITSALITSDGTIIWFPSETDGPSTNRFTTIVSDGTRTATNTFTVFVNEVNAAPLLPLQDDLTINEQTMLSVTNAASDSDVPSQPLSYSLIATRLADDSPVGGPAMSSQGVITWQTTEADGPGGYRFTTIVSDGSFSTTNSFTVTVSEVNTAPVLPAQADRSLVGLQTLTVINTATDGDIPSSPLSYSLFVSNVSDGSPVVNATIDSAGVITWTPVANQLPSTNAFRTVVSDGTLSATNSFTVAIRQANAVPILPAIPQQTVYELTPLTVTNTATCQNPAATLSYALLNPPVGVNVNASGIITWTPSAAQSPSTGLIITIATASDPLDLVNPELRATNSFTVVVRLMSLSLALSSTNTTVLRWPAPSPGWTLQECAALNANSWVNSSGVVTTVGNQNQVIVPRSAGPKFYRLMHP